MNYIEEIFLRADIQQIRASLLYGVEEMTIERCSYIERTESALQHVTAQLHETYPKEEDYERIANLVFECISIYEDVYMEIGLQTGAIIAAQVCQNTKTISPLPSTTGGDTGPGPAERV